MWRGWRTVWERQSHHNLLEQKDVAGKVFKRFLAGGPLTGIRKTVAQGPSQPTSLYFFLQIRSWEDSHTIFYILTITAFHCNSTVVIEISWTANPEVYTTWPLHLPAPDLDKGFPGDTSGKEPARRGFNSWAGKISWRRAWQLTPVFLPEESPWTEEPGRLQSMGLQRIRHD